MITYIDTKNREKYQVLFDKAEETLKKAANTGLISLGIDDVNELSIATLNQYFAYLQDLITATAISDENDDQKAEKENLRSYFLRLPLDEGLFEINANTRTIKIPSNFSSNGVGVQGDETAEIVYFSIDRYFDHMDLANDDMNIVIQWETRDKDRATISGISPNFGKDIGTIPGKIIFGWPIYSELTESPTPIKFAVRFFSLGEADAEGVRALNYSLATLPAEITVGATIDYDLINKTVMEVDRGKMITSRIKTAGIYDPSIPTPQAPTISTPLFIDGEDASVRIADLPEEGDIVLKVSARPTDFGAVQYSWCRFAYDSATGEYASTADALPNDVIDNGVYEEVTELADDIYYQITSADGVEPIVYEPVVLDDLLESREYDNGFHRKDGTVVKLYKRYSTANVNSVGIYTVNVGARNGVNTVVTTMDAADGIKVPGPLKPIISDPEETDTISVTPDDHIIHVLVNDGAVTLSTSAVKGEDDESAVVKISYDWKKISDNIEEPIDGESVGDSEIKLHMLGQDGHGFCPADDNYDACAENQARVTLIQKGSNIFVYHTGEELNTYTSTAPGQGDGKWLGFDIDTGKESIVGLIWGESYELTEADAAEAAGIGLEAGHIIFWAKAEDLVSGRTIKVDGNELTIVYRDSVPSAETYTFNEDKSNVTIEGLATSGLDQLYVAEAIAERNKVKTSAKSGVYRLTNAPEKPVIKRQTSSGKVVSDYTTETNAITVNKKRNGVFRSISFSIDPIEHSDALSYIWMRLNVQDIESDWEDEHAKLQIDLDDFLSDLFVDQPGDADIPVDGVFGLTELSNLGEVVDGEDNGPTLQFSDNTPTGIYYCIVVNELNNYRVANVTPFYSVVD